MKGPYAVIIVENHSDGVVAVTIPIAKGKRDALKIAMAKHGITPEYLHEAWVFKGELPTPFIAEMPPPIKPIIRKGKNRF